MADSPNSMSQPGPSSSNAEIYSPLFLEQRRRAIEAAAVGFLGIDGSDPALSSGHGYAIRKSTDLTSYTKRHQRKAAMDITPQDVIDVLTAANIKNWVLMGLNGYVG